MKYLKKLLYLLPILMFTILFGCQNNSKIKIGVMQIVEHESLNDARNGFVDELKNLGYENGEKVEFDFQIAGGELSNCASIASKFVNDRKNLVLAISTPCAQAMANTTRDIPIIATAITDFESSGIIESSQKPNTNVTGVSDLASIDKIIELITTLNPNAKKIGILYSVTDPSPQYQAKIAEEKINSLGLECKSVAISQIHEVQQATERLAKEVDALYTPIDKITFSAMPQISQIFEKNNKFVVCAEDTMISKGAVGTYGINYYELGKLAAKQAVEILEGKNIPQNMPIEYLKESSLKLNYELIKKIGIDISNDLGGN